MNSAEIKAGIKVWVQYGFEWRQGIVAGIIKGAELVIIDGLRRTEVDRMKPRKYDHYNSIDTWACFRPNEIFACRPR